MRSDSDDFTGQSGITAGEHHHLWQDELGETYDVGQSKIGGEAIPEQVIDF